jgi:endonuclease YncB( thermonuclease family)
LGLDVVLKRRRAQLVRREVVFTRHSNQKMRNLKRLIFLAFLMVLSTPAAAAVVGIPSIVDGDTLQIHGERIRLFGIDAPESKQLCAVQSKQIRCGQVAANALDAMISRRPISCTPEDHDQYGRTVAVCYLDKVDLNEWMVRQGHAVAYTRYSANYVAAEAEARKAKLGIWAGTFERPDEWRRSQRESQAASIPAAPSAKCAIKGNINSKGRHIYHMPGQEDYEHTRINEAAGERWFCFEGEAVKAGWIRAKR